VFNLPLSASHTGHTVTELPAGSRSTRSEELGEGIITLTLTLIFTLGFCRFFMSAGSDSNVHHRRCYVRSDRFCRLVERQQGIDTRVGDGRDGVLSGNRGIHMVVTEDECSGEQNDCASREGHSETLSVSS